MPLPRAGFALQLAAVATVGLALRLLYVSLTPAIAGGGDMLFYHQVANLLADGKGFVNPFYPAGNVPTAQHPPLYPYALAVLSSVGIDTPQGHRLLGVVCGTVVVVLAGLLGRRVAGPRAGLVAAGLTAVSPTLLRADGSLLSETLYGPLVLLALLLAHRLLERPARPARREAAALGALLGLAALVRQEALLLAVLLVVPVVWRASSQRLALGALAVGVMVLVLAPWVVRNARVFDAAPVISTNGDSVVAYANCERTYAGPDTGGWLIGCWPPIADFDDVSREAAQRRRGVAFALDHVERWPAVVTARVLRTFSLRHTGGEGDGYVNGSIPLRATGHALFLLSLPFAVAGAVLLRRRGASLLVVLVPVALVTASSAIGWGAPRFRYAAEVPIAILVAVGLLALADRVRGRTNPAPRAAVPA